MTEDNPYELLQALLGGQLHTSVIDAIVNALGAPAAAALANGVRVLDRRLAGQLRDIDAIAAQAVAAPKARDSARKRLEQMARAFVRRAAQSTVNGRATDTRQLLALAALDLIRAHGAVDVLDQWGELERRRTGSARERRQDQTKAKDKLISDEVQKHSGSKRSQRNIAQIAATNISRSTGSTVKAATVRARLRKNSKK